jgi:hypothetical protein
MTPKEKAKDLFNKFIEFSQDWDEVDGYIVNKYNAKQCALIAVNELIEQEQKYNNGSFYPSNYWSEVKQEIEKL